MAFFLFLLFTTNKLFAQKDSFRVLSYNVLYYGQKPNCQGASSIYHNYLKTIVGYINPDFLGLVKMGSIKRTQNDAAGNAPFGFADSIISNVLNPIFPARFDYCPFTNNATADNISLLFYNKQKFGYLGMILNYSYITDFNLYKFYYKNSLSIGNNDTIFIYMLLNHTQSGDDETIRFQQLNGCLQVLKQKFTHLPNLINMGDFNFHNSSEQCYNALIAPTDTNFRFYDPPFVPENVLQYPADWTTNSSLFAKYLTTSTRQYANLPNSCGTDGGAKSWYDHMLISSSLLSGVKNIKYIRGTYKTIGNDGNRVGVSVNTTNPVNNSVPANMANALYQMSNKYPIVADFEIQFPINDITEQSIEKTINIYKFSTEDLQLSIPIDFSGKELKLCLYNIYGQELLNATINITDSNPSFPLSLIPGIYILRWSVNKNVTGSNKLVAY